MSNLVSIKRRGGKGTANTTHFDVYIGGSVHNRYWDLPESEWNNNSTRVFTRQGKKKPCNKRVSGTVYRRNILSKPDKLTHTLRTLKGKTLGCWDADSPGCHGHDLLDITLNTYMLSPNSETSSPVAFIRLFGRPSSPLSNFYRCAINIDGLKFLSGLHFMYYMRARDLGLDKIVEDLGKASNCHRVCEISSKMEFQVFKNGLTITAEDSVRQLLVATRAKYSQVRNFRDECKSVLPHCLIGQHTPNTISNKLWGIGLPENEVERIDPSKYEGMNLVGWIIMLVHAEAEEKLSLSIDLYRSVIPVGSALEQGLNTVVNEICSNPGRKGME